LKKFEGLQGFGQHNMPEGHWCLEGNGSQFEELDKEDWVEEVDMCLGEVVDMLPFLLLSVSLSPFK
jgi:hypothetical protein